MVFQPELMSGLRIYAAGDFDYDDETFVFTNVAAIPEPETYAMLLAGLGIIGWTVRRDGSAKV